MPLNVPGILAPIHFLFNPRIIIPGLSVKDIRHIDFAALKRAGYKGAVFDKDNCLTIPGKDTLVPDIQASWNECRQVFGDGNVLVVSNSAGTRLDAGGIQAESVRHHLGVAVLFHPSMKPAYSCIKLIHSYFGSLRTPVREDELVVVGDRLFTDIVMANRMREKSLVERLRGVFTSSSGHSDGKSTPELDSKETAGSVARRGDQNHHHPALARRGTLGIWTTGVWQKEAMFMRFCERKLLEGVMRWIVIPRNTQNSNSNPSDSDPNSYPNSHPTIPSPFVREVPPPPPPKQSVLKSVWKGLVAVAQTVQFRRG